MQLMLRKCLEMQFLHLACTLTQSTATTGTEWQAGRNAERKTQISFSFCLLSFFFFWFSSLAHKVVEMPSGMSQGIAKVTGRTPPGPGLD